MLATALKAKVIAGLLAAAVIGGGTVGTVYMLHHSTAAVADDSIPMPAAPPTAAPGLVAAPVPAQYAGAPAVAAPVSPTPYAPAPAYTPAPATPPPAVEQVGLLSDAQLDQLLAPIALYPDPLIAAMLPASTYPDELASAAAWLSANPQPADAAIQQMPWEQPIQVLAHSPSVLIWMYNNQSWTGTLGTAFTYQPNDVMASVQRLRTEAVASGALVDSPQQVVVEQGSDICIEPASPEVVYVPVYDWRTAYIPGRWHGGLTFFAGFNTGSWLDFDFDWGSHAVVVGAQWDRGWNHRWDDDHNAHNVSVRNTTVINNKTVINNNATEVKVGGQAWARDAARPAPRLPQNVRPGRPNDHARPGGIAAPAARRDVAAPLPPEQREAPRAEPQRAEPQRVEPPKPEPRDVTPAREPAHIDVAPREVPREAPAPAPKADERGAVIERANDRGPAPDRGNADRGPAPRAPDNQAPDRGPDRGNDRGDNGGHANAGKLSSNGPRRT